MKGKIHPGGIVKHATGPTFTENDPAKFPNKGKTTGKPDGVSTVDRQRTGPTFTEHSPLFEFPNADTHPKSSKVIASSNTKGFDLTATAKTRIASGGSGFDGNAGLKESYPKSGKTMSHKARHIL
ncbi:MAG TPA: hypothetical protein VIJ38_02135 [Acidobacteriaceae bacterium]